MLLRAAYLFGDYLLSRVTDTRIVRLGNVKTTAVTEFLHVTALRDVEIGGAGL